MICPWLPIGAMLVNGQSVDDFGWLVLRIRLHWYGSSVGGGCSIKIDEDVVEDTL